MRHNQIKFLYLNLGHFLDHLFSLLAIVALMIFSATLAVTRIE